MGIVGHRVPLDLVVARGQLLLHGRSRNRLLIDQLCFGLPGLLMTAKPSPPLSIAMLYRGHRQRSTIQTETAQNGPSGRGRERPQRISAGSADDVAYGSKATFRVSPRYFRFTLELGHRLMQLADGLTFLPPVIRQKPREQTRTNVHDLDQEVLILLGFPDRVLRS